MFKRLFQLPMDSKDSFFIFGPRGVGKTFWLKSQLAKQPHRYIDLLEPKTFRTLKAQPELLQSFIPPSLDGRVVIDEIQRVPELLDEVHRLIESTSYRFILTGSSARKLKQKGVNLLAGRAIRYVMHPFILQELGENFQLEHAITQGMLPATFY